MQQKIVLFPRRVCETLSGDMAYTVGRLAFRRGRPMLVEHVGGIYLEHDLSGRILTAGYGTEYSIVYVSKDDLLSPAARMLLPGEGNESP
jgi:FtsP/CotA-like multicopper oxidase with cupredoxin domain